MIASFVSFFVPLSIYLSSCLSSPTQTPLNQPEPITQYTSHKSAMADSAVVATAHPLATQVGLNIIRQGGNAIDAAIAVQFALAVVYPRAGNLGGGGFLVYRSGDGKEVSTLDFREKAPSAAQRDMFLDEKKRVIRGKSRRGHLAAGVPGTVDGCYKMFEKYSKLKDWQKLVQPAINLAQYGFGITQMEAGRLNRNRDDFAHNNLSPVIFVKEKEWEKGDILVQTDLAHTLEFIRDRGKAGFYEGEIADKIVAEMKRGGGLISYDDLKNYESVWRKPLYGQYRGYDIITMPPPSSGGIALLQLLGTVEDYPLSTYDFHSVEATHLIVEAERRVYADRAKHLGDSDFYPVQVNKLISKNYIRSRFKDFDANKASISNKITAGDLTNVSEQTTHLSIIDTEGNAVSLTTTLNDNYGCHTVVGGAGFILNNEMDDFSVKPGEPNTFGAIGGVANAIEGNKRPLSSMTPTIVTKDGKVFMVLGTPGGTTIITSVFQCITNVIDFDMSMYKAVQSRRFHFQWQPDTLFIERFGFKKETLKTLKNMGHNIKERENIGAVEAILAHPYGKMEGVADNRGDDDVLGF